MDDRLILGVDGFLVISQGIDLARVNSHNPWDEPLVHMAIEKMNKAVSMIENNRRVGT
jgi:hypothetical protein